MGFLANSIAAIGGLFKSSTSFMSDLNNPYLWLGDNLLGRKSTSGENVTPYSALTLGVYYACIRNQAEDIAKIRFNIFKEEGDTLELQEDHPVARLLNIMPNPEMDAMTFRETMQSWAAGWGNGYAEIERLESDAPLYLWPIHPSRVRVVREHGQVFYEVRSNPMDNGGFKITRLNPEDMFHLHGLGGVGLEGFSVVRLAAESIGLGLAVQKFGASFFGNGTTIGGVLEHPETLGEPALTNLRNSWITRHAGASNAHKPIVLEEGLKWKPTSIPPEEAQFIETQQFNVEDICRWFRMPPHKVQQLLRATFSNIAEQSLEYTGDCLMPWMTRWEQQVKTKLLGLESNLVAKHAIIELLKAIPSARSEFYNKLFQMGAMSPNDIRKVEGLNPVEGGDQYFVQLNLVPLKDAGKIALQNATAAKPSPENEKVEGEKEEKPALPAPKEEEKKPKKAKKKSEEAAFLIEDAAKRVINKELKAVGNALNRYKSVESAAYKTWITMFYSEQLEFCCSAFDPIVNTFVAEKDHKEAREYVFEVIKAHFNEVVRNRIENKWIGESTHDTLTLLMKDALDIFDDN